VYLDRTRLRRSTQRFFRVGVPARRLRPGRHRLLVISRDRAGNRTKKSVGFSRCRPVSRALTG
jgi:hypothetical protein